MCRKLAYLPEVSRAFDLLTDATEVVAPALNGRKLSVGVSECLIAHLPKGWARHSKALDAYIRETRIGEDVELIWSNDLDVLPFDRQTRQANLSEHEIFARNGAHAFFFVKRSGLANCRQTRAIIDELSR